MYRKKIATPLSLCTALALSMGLPTNVFATNIGSGGGSGASSALLNVAPSQLNVTVPMSLPISVAADGTVTTATEAKIVNNSIGRVKVANVAITGANNWAIIDFDSDMSTYKVNEKKLGFMLNGGKTIGGMLGFDETQYPTLAGKNDTDADELLLDYDAVITPQSNAVVDEEVARVAFTVDWDSSESAPEPIHMTAQEATTAGYTYELLTDDTYSLTGMPTTVENVVFPTSIEGKAVTKLRFKYGGETPNTGNKVLKSVVIPEHVTEIGESAFRNCESLTSVTIGNSVTSIGEYAFYVCKSLTSVTIPDSVTEIGKGAFRNCESLTSVTIGNGVKTIGTSAFYECKSLTSITIPEGVTEIGIGAFDSCSGLTSVTIPNSVTWIGFKAFSYTIKITYHGTATGAPWGASYVNDVKYPPTTSSGGD